MPTDEMKERIQEMNNLPDISGDDSPELRRLCEQSAREVKLTGSVSAATSLEMIGFMRELEIRQRAAEHVAWCRYTYDQAGSIKSIATCDSDAKGAFKVYAALQLAELERLQAENERLQRENVNLQLHVEERDSLIGGLGDVIEGRTKPLEQVRRELGIKK
jgi:hypothetical protein